MLNWSKKIGMDLANYFFKGGRVDAALQWAGRSRIPMGEYPHPNAVPIEEYNGHIVYSQQDIMRHWQVTVKGILILKNNSKTDVYNITILNGKDLFTTCEPIPKLAGLAPNEKMELKVTFTQYMDAHGGQETETLPDIPTAVENHYLIIQYQNERGTKFLTKFALSFKAQHNEYAFK